MLGVPRSWVYEQSRKGRIPTVTLGRYRRYRAEAIDPVDRSSSRRGRGDAGEPPLRGTGQLYEKHGAYYGRWRTSDGRKRNRRIGAMRAPGSREGLTRSQAERALQRCSEEDEAFQPTVPEQTVTVGEAASCSSPSLASRARGSPTSSAVARCRRSTSTRASGDRPLGEITSDDVEALAAAMRTAGLKPKSVHNVIVFLHGVFEHAIAQGWAATNPVRGAARPKRRRTTDSNPDLQFLTMSELDAVFRAIPDEAVKPTPAPTRRGRPAPRRRAPPTSSARRSGCWS